MTLPQVTLPPYARRLDVRATRAAFAAGTLGTVGDDGSGVDEQRGVELRHADRHNADVMHGYDFEARRWRTQCQYGDECSRCDAVGRCERAERREAERQAFLRRVQYVDPRERRA